MQQITCVWFDGERPVRAHWDLRSTAHGATLAHFQQNRPRVSRYRARHERDDYIHILIDSREQQRASIDEHLLAVHRNAARLIPLRRMELHLHRIAMHDLARDALPSSAATDLHGAVPSRGIFHPCIHGMLDRGVAIDPLEGHVDRAIAADRPYEHSIRTAIDRRAPSIARGGHQLIALLHLRLQHQRSAGLHLVALCGTLSGDGSAGAFDVHRHTMNRTRGRRPIAIKGEIA